MAVQDEQGQGGLGMDLEIVESMAQGEIPVQDIPMMQDEFPPQPNPKLEMGAAGAAAVYDTTPRPPAPKSLPSPR